MMSNMLTFVFILFSSSTLLAQEGTGEVPTSPGTGFGQTFVMIAIALVFFYFILWRPEQKRRKALEDQRKTMKVGDKVIAMGIVGIVDTIKNQTTILKMVDGSKIEVLKGAVTDVNPPEEEKAEKT